MVVEQTPKGCILLPNATKALEVTGFSKPLYLGFKRFKTDSSITEGPAPVSKQRLIGVLFIMMAYRLGFQFYMQCHWPDFLG